MQDFEEHQFVVRFSVAVPKGSYARGFGIDPLISNVNDKIEGALCGLFREGRGTFSSPRTSIFKEANQNAT